MDKRKILVTGFPGWLSGEFVKTLWKDERLEPNKEYFTMNYPKYDVRRYNDCLKLTKDIDTVFHIAGIIHPKKVKEFYDINTKGTENMVRASIENNVSKFVYISSNSSFGHKPHKLLMNEYFYGNPYMGYGKSKQLAEDIVSSYSLNSDMQYIILRPCWFYGGYPPKRLVKLFTMIKKGKPIIFGDGNNLRSMTHVHNVIHAMLLCLKYEHDDDFCIADERPYTTNEIYNTIAELLNVKNFKPRHIPALVSKVCRFGDKWLQKVGKYSSYIHVAGEMTCNIAFDISKAKRLLGYKPKISLREGMKKTLENIHWI